MKSLERKRVFPAKGGLIKDVTENVNNCVEELTSFARNIRLAQLRSESLDSVLNVSSLFPTKRFLKKNCSDTFRSELIKLEGHASTKKKV